MIHITQSSLNEELYTFRGRTFYCDGWTINRLNYALALNGSKERYEKVKQNTASKS